METINKILPIIKQNILFEKMNDSEILFALNQMNYKISSYSKNEIIHHSETLLSHFGLVISGTVNVSIDDIEGNRTIMAHVNKGNTFGESISFLGKKNMDIYITSESNSVILWLSPVCISSDNCNLNKLKNNFISMIANRTLQLNNRIQILSKLKLREKILLYFAFLSKQKNSKEFNITLSREDFASYIGTNRSALSRELSKMKKDGLIDYNKNRFIVKI